MKTLRVLLSGFILLLANLVGILVGFMAYQVLRPIKQLIIQLPIAVVLSVLLYLAWVLLIRNLRYDRLCVRSTGENVMVFVASLVWGPVIYVPLHYFTQGYLTNAENLLALLIFQVPVNASAIAVGAWLIHLHDTFFPSNTSAV